MYVKCFLYREIRWNDAIPHLILVYRLEFQAFKLEAWTIWGVWGDIRTSVWLFYSYNTNYFSKGETWYLDFLLPDQDRRPATAIYRRPFAVQNGIWFNWEKIKSLAGSIVLNHASTCRFEAACQLGLLSARVVAVVLKLY